MWEMRSLGPVAIPHRYISPTSSERKYTVVTSKWLFFKNGNRHVVLLGALDGDLVGWAWNSVKRVNSSCLFYPKLFCL
jgi:hypothetical protein